VIFVSVSNVAKPSIRPMPSNANSIILRIATSGNLGDAITIPSLFGFLTFKVISFSVLNVVVFATALKTPYWATFFQSCTKDEIALGKPLNEANLSMNAPEFIGAKFVFFARESK
jgi:hypothetical protein